MLSDNNRVTGKWRLCGKGATSFGREVKRCNSSNVDISPNLPASKGSIRTRSIGKRIAKTLDPALLHSLCNLSMIGLGPHFLVDFLWILGTHSLCCGVSPFNDSTTRLWSFVKERRRPVCEDCQQRRGPCRLTLITFLCDNAASGSSLGK